MDVQLKELIETIKSEGVESAEVKAKEIIADAEKKRDDMIAVAENDAEEIRAKAKSDAQRMKASAEESIRQAGRDLILSLESSITELFDSVVKRESAKVLSGQGLEKAIISLLSNWSEEKDSLELLLPEKDLKEIGDGLLDALKKELRSEVLLKPAPGLDAGFKISEKDGAAYYNFTSEGIAEILSQYVNPKLSALLRESVKSDKQ